MVNQKVGLRNHSLAKHDIHLGLPNSKLRGFPDEYTILTNFYPPFSFGCSKNGKLLPSHNLFLLHH